MAITAAFLAGTTGVESRRSTRASEFWEITGVTGAAGDSVAITTRFIKRPIAVLGGAFTYAIVGQVVTVTSAPALVGDVTTPTKAAIEIIGIP